MIQISSRRVQTAISALVMATLLLIPAIAMADETPVRVRMSYQPPLSNSGPSDATGTIEITFADGELQGNIDGLMPAPGRQYEVWLYDSSSEKMLPLTTFEADPSGVTHFDAHFDETVPEEGWDLVVITIQATPDGSPGTDGHWSLIGAFGDNG